MKRNAAVAGAVALVLLCGRAEARNELLDAFTPQTVAAALRASGASGVAYRPPPQGGAIVVTATDPGGRAINMVLRACDADAPQSCRGLYMAYRWSLDGVRVDLAGLNAFNERYAFAKAHVDRGGGLVLDRYVIADGGIGATNLAENIAVFMQMPERLLAEIAVDGAPKPDSTPTT